MSNSLAFISQVLASTTGIHHHTQFLSPLSRFIFLFMCICVCIFALRGQMKRSLELVLQVAANHYYGCWELNCDPLSESSLPTPPTLRSPLKSLVKTGTHGKLLCWGRPWIYFFLKNYFIFNYVHMCASVCRLIHIWVQVPVESSRGCWVPWNQNYRDPNHWTIYPAWPWTFLSSCFRFINSWAYRYRYG